MTRAAGAPKAKIWTRSDPWLTARLNGMAVIRRGDLAITNAVMNAMGLWLHAVGQAIAGHRTPDLLRADAGDSGPISPDEVGTLPDLSLWPPASVWSGLIDDVVLPEVSKLFGVAFNKATRESDLTPAHYRQAYLSLVSDRLTLQKWPENVFEDVRGVIADGIKAGDSIDKITADLGDVLKVDHYAYEARRIARTETMGAVNAGTHDGGSAYADLTGDDMFKQWYSTLDSRTRPDHRAAHRQVVPIGATFSIGGWAMSYPGDPDGPADEVCNCRCTVLMLSAQEASHYTDPDAWDDNPSQITESQEMDPAMTDALTAAAPAAPTEDLPDAEPADAAPDEQAAGDVGTWSGMLVTFDVPSGDGRIVATPPGPMRVRPLPLPLIYQDALAPEHMGAVRVGLITEVLQTPEGIWASGTFNMDDPRAAGIAGELAAGQLGWTSVDLDDTTAEFDEESGTERATDWRLMGAALVTYQAFPYAKIASGVTAPPATALSASALVFEDPDAEPGAAGDVWAQSARAWSLAAAADTPVFAPPAGWFADPALTEYTALTVTDDGRVFGHLAPWDVCHIGIRQECRTAPRSASGYAYFHLGSARTAEGTDVAVGTITLGTDHANGRASLTDAQRHYADTGMAAAVVCAGEDEYGIWVSGAVLPGADLVTLRRAPLSGDWRTIGGSLELVGALAVNTPGFPIPRMRRHSLEPGKVFSLTAAGASLPAPAAGGAVSGPGEVSEAAVEDFARRVALSIDRRQRERADRAARFDTAIARMGDAKYTRAMRRLQSILDKKGS